MKKIMLVLLIYFNIGAMEPEKQKLTETVYKVPHSIMMLQTSQATEPSEHWVSSAQAKAHQLVLNPGSVRPELLPGVTEQIAMPNNVSPVVQKVKKEKKRRKEKLRETIYKVPLTIIMLQLAQAFEPLERWVSSAEALTRSTNSYMVRAKGWRP